MDFDDDFDWQDGIVIGGFFDYMTEQEAEERCLKKLEKDYFDPDTPGLDDEDDLP